MSKNIMSKNLENAISNLTDSMKIGYVLKNKLSKCISYKEFWLAEIESSQFIVFHNNYDIISRKIIFTDKKNPYKLNFIDTLKRKICH